MARGVRKSVFNFNVFDMTAISCRYSQKSQLIMPKGYEVYLVKPVRLLKGDIARLVTSIEP